MINFNEKEKELKPEDLNKHLIENLAQNDPTLYAIMMTHRRGDIDYEQALIYMVKAMHEQKNTYFNKSVELHQHSTRPLFLNKTQ